ncbi:hypothetical protein BC332_28512 [Capsicum chinense]|nr:hypothetical protein BC332_28512 [Capsicum chinense]
MWGVTRPQLQFRFLAFIIFSSALTNCSRWVNLKERLLSVCPSCSVSFYLNEPSPRSASSPVYLLTFCSRDRRGLLHDVTQVLCELELTIQRVKEATTPDDRVLDILFITELANKELGLNTAGWVGTVGSEGKKRTWLRSSYTQERQDETYTQLHAVLGQSCSCELQLAGPQYDNLLCSSLSPSVSEELFRCKPSDNEFRTQALSPDMTQLKKSSVTIDTLSPGHTLLQIGCVDHKGFLYDIMRTLKDCNIQSRTISELTVSDSPGILKSEELSAFFTEPGAKMGSNLCPDWKGVNTAPLVKTTREQPSYNRNTAVTEISDITEY